MRGMTTKPEYIIQCLSLYNEIEVELIRSVTAKGVARFRSPKIGLEEGHKPYIAILNGDSGRIYQACETYDSETTQTIMNLIREKFIIPEGDESLFYIIFVVLHEAGHWYDYHNRRSWYNQNINDDGNCTAEEYRNRPLEKSADDFALEHFEEAWNELNSRLFHNMLDPLEKQID